MTRTTAAILLIVFSPVTGLAQAGIDLAAARELASAPVSEASEQRLDAIVRALSRAPRDPQTEAWLIELSDRAPQVLVPINEGPALVPLVDVGAAARVVLRQWRRREAAVTTAQSLRQRQPSALAEYFVAGPERRQGVLDAIAAGGLDLLAYRDEAWASFAAPGGDELAAAVGVALADEALLVRVVTEGTAPVALRLLRSEHTRLGKRVRLTLLHNALQRPALASAALFAIADMSPGDAEPLLWESLGDAVLGATAATIIARDADRHTLSRLAAMIDSDAPLLTRQRAALALALSDDAEAQALAHAWSKQ